MKSIFITKIDVHASRLPIMDLPDCDYEPEYREYQEGWSPTKEAFTVERIHADYYLNVHGMRTTYGFSKQAAEVLKPFRECIKDNNREIHSLSKDKGRLKDQLNDAHRNCGEYAAAIDKLRSSFWVRLRFLFKRNISL